MAFLMEVKIEKKKKEKPKKKKNLKFEAI